VETADQIAAQPHARLRADVAALAHCPVRSREQFIGKVIVGHLAHLLTRPTDPTLARHWRTLYEEIRSGAELGEERLREIACNYGLPSRLWKPVAAIELIEDPVPLTVEQRYRVAAVVDPLRLLMRFAEALVAVERVPVADAPPPPRD
jgi:hypothetical protein